MIVPVQANHSNPGFSQLGVQRKNEVSFCLEVFAVTDTGLKEVRVGSISEVA